MVSRRYKKNTGTSELKKVSFLVPYVTSPYLIYLVFYTVYWILTAVMLSTTVCKIILTIHKLHFHKWRKAAVEFYKGEDISLKQRSA